MSLGKCPYNDNVCLTDVCDVACKMDRKKTRIRAADDTLSKAALEGRKDDQGKAPWSLLPFDAVGEIVAVLKFGAQKYAVRNWEKGMAWDRPFDACLRHLTAWHRGEAKDAETGLSHLAHAGCCILFLLAYEIRSVGKDTRPQA